MLAGGIYGIIRWQQGNCKRQRHIRAWIQFLELAEFQVLRNHSAVSVILERAKGINAQMDICFAEILEKMKKSYYIIRGWKDGAPTMRTLKRLGIKVPECAKEVYPYGKG